MTWREFMLTTCAWIIALVAGVLSYAEVARSEPQTHTSFHGALADQHVQLSDTTSVSGVEQ